MADTARPFKVTPRCIDTVKGEAHPGRTRAFATYAAAHAAATQLAAQFHADAAEFPGHVGDAVISGPAGRVVVNALTA